MPAFQSIADLLRHEILSGPATLYHVAKSTDILQPPLWRFVNQGTDPKLGSAERLLRFFGYVLVKEEEAEAAGLKYVRPSAAPETRRTIQRQRNAKAKAEEASTTDRPARVKKGGKGSSSKRPTPKRSAPPRSGQSRRPKV